MPVKKHSIRCLYSYNIGGPGLQHFAGDMSPPRSFAASRFRLQAMSHDQPSLIEYLPDDTRTAANLTRKLLESGCETSRMTMQVFLPTDMLVPAVCRLSLSNSS
ncbi:hypothetical protein HRR83_002910 [Exophiala dermatitidis]|uniref:Uncharacterized protein n=1 Tax=Exophiala dermatitidis TaxID=5970 RepID=A0AAN6IQK9_EXODE|nr:hypothetical protein HRR73_008083 [Exophiala dermatitidis]KAJ4520659.1 hypothetical protein HRR74_003659 [Exophiala dermatitidis]KAJ4537697.1 hypothetical protein HRR76_005687 [Exophiala dermatitidis]KAJ4551638.1 hypothetical protein HRR77_002872 [Exophiala dermatitidis]KAJ4569372.1 hypothetical protein HRR79_004225 [Exophiala dermatitidis]